MIKGSESFIVLSALVTLPLMQISGCNRSVMSLEVTSGNVNQSASTGSQRTSTSQATSVPNAHEDEIPSFDEKGMVEHRNRYSNYEYGYTVEIPQGLVGFTDPAPSPQHGMGIVLSKEPKSYIWVDGSYNSFFFTSPDEAIDQDLEFLAKDGTELKVLRRDKTKLQKLTAIRSTVRYKSLATGESRVQDVVMALRLYKSGAGGITYTIGLIAPESRYNEDVAVLERIMNGWTARPLPRP